MGLPRRPLTTGCIGAVSIVAKIDDFGAWRGFYVGDGFKQLYQIVFGLLSRRLAVRVLVAWWWLYKIDVGAGQLYVRACCHIELKN